LRRVNIFFLILAVLLFTSCKASSPTSPERVKNPPVISSFDAYPNPIHYRESTTLSWNVTNATTIEIDRGIGQVGATGSKQVGPLTETTTYTLRATNNDGTTTKACVVEVKAGAYFELVSYSTGYRSYGSCFISGIVRNSGNGTGYNVMITFQAYNASNVIIDTAHGFPADLGDIPAGVSAAFEAIFFDTYDWNIIAKVEYVIEWLNREGMKVMQKGWLIGN